LTAADRRYGQDRQYTQKSNRFFHKALAQLSWSTDDRDEEPWVWLEVTYKRLSVAGWGRLRRLLAWVLRSANWCCCAPSVTIPRTHRIIHLQKRTAWVARRQFITLYLLASGLWRPFVDRSHGVHERRHFHLDMRLLTRDLLKLQSARGSYRHSLDPLH